MMAPPISATFGGRMDTLIACGVSGLKFESHRGRLCLLRQTLRYTALCTGCEPLLQGLGRLSLPPSVGR